MTSAVIDTPKYSKAIIIDNTANSIARIHSSLTWIRIRSLHDLFLSLASYDMPLIYNLQHESTLTFWTNGFFSWNLSNVIILIVLAIPHFFGIFHFFNVYIMWQVESSQHSSSSFSLEQHDILVHENVYGTLSQEYCENKHLILGPKRTMKNCCWNMIVN